MTETEFAVAPVTEENWPDLEALFEGKGGPKYCWCMAWRELADRTSADNSARKRGLREQLRQHGQIGLLGYLGGEPVAWCSVAPRETFRKLNDIDHEEDGPVWSVTCFFVRRDHRAQGVSAKLLTAAADFARSRGAKILEGYPVDPGSPSYRFMGFLPLFNEQGFQKVGRAGSRRHVVQRAL